MMQNLSGTKWLFDGLGKLLFVVFSRDGHSLLSIHGVRTLLFLPLLSNRFTAYITLAPTVLLMLILQLGVTISEHCYMQNVAYFRLYPAKWLQMRQISSRNVEPFPGQCSGYLYSCIPLFPLCSKLPLVYLLCLLHRIYPKTAPMATAANTVVYPNVSV